ncbi:MAG: hypothetical protein ACM65L_13560 [Microcoleus sp.]
MVFVFPPHIQAGIISGTYEVVKNSAGVLLGIARDRATGHFVGAAIGMVAEPLLAIPDFVLGVAQMVQTDRGFKETYKRLDVIQYGLNSLSANVGILSASTAVIGVGVVAIAALSAVNLHQTLKMREDIKELKLTVTHGFINIEALMKDHKAAVIAEIKLLAESINFEQHRLILSQAYEKFAMAQKLIQNALLMEDQHTRNSTLTSAQHILANADERKQLASLNMENTPVSKTHEEVSIVAEPAEMALYQNLQQKSHFKSLRDQLRFLIKPSLRQQHESYISQKANTSGYKALAPSSWQEVNDLTVANLYWYFQGME